MELWNSSARVSMNDFRELEGTDLSVTHVKVLISSPSEIQSVSRVLNANGHGGFP